MARNLIVRPVILFLCLARFLSSVVQSEEVSTKIPVSTSAINSAASLSSKSNGTKVDWVQSLLQSYETSNKDESTSNGTYDMEASASGHRFRVNHVNPAYDDDYRDHSPSASYQRERDHHYSPRSRSYQDDSDRRDGSYSHGNRGRQYEAEFMDSSKEQPIRKSDPDYGQHYDSDGHQYDFGYDVKDKEGALTFRKESGDAKSLKGSYGIREPDGRLRIVRYVADEKGFRAKVDTNEPGTGSEDAANVFFNGYDAERIPSHDVLHKDRGQHSFKHGHYNKHSPMDSGLYEEQHHTHHHHQHARDYADESQDEVGTYRLHDQIPMEVQPAVGPRMRVAAVPLESNMLDMDDHETRAPYKEVIPRYFSSVVHHSDQSSHRSIPRPYYSASYPRRRYDSAKLSDFTYNIPYNSITGFFFDDFDCCFNYSSVKG